MIRVLTVNLGGVDSRHGTWQRRAGRVAALAATADIVVAQAAPEDDAFTALTGCLPAHGHVVRAAGQAAMSRLPVAASHVVPLSRRHGHDDPFERRLQAIRLNAGEPPLTLLNAHFSWVAEQARDNIEETLAHAASLDGDVVLAGDFNQQPGSAATAMLAAAGWTDAWASLHGDGGETFETGNLWGRLDQVWTRDDAVRRVREIAVVGGDGEQALSDHRGVAVALA